MGPYFDGLICESQVDLKHCDDLRMPKRGLSGSAAEVFDSSPMGKSVNTTAMSALFDIGDDDGPTFKGHSPERGHSQGQPSQAEETNILEL
ncbi:unnamed protein product [Cladocopium goreaui]|uniref:Uncharacterized protein n=1 Tax=Cladocopium goreaui TaxID=2562237 RepID=A0A9P1G6C7_9DINO|nr:unnamed protein product [Cladocopium goreaui]